MHPCTTTCPAALYPTSLPRRALALPRAPQPQALPPSSRGLRCCHVSHGSGPRLSTQEGSGAAMCRMTPDPASLLGRALVLPHAPWLQIPPPYLGGAPVLSRVTRLRPPPPCSGGLQCYYVPMSLYPASLLGRALTLSRVPQPSEGHET
jgi:hypothetical protein